MASSNVIRRLVKDVTELESSLVGKPQSVTFRTFHESDDGALTLVSEHRNEIMRYGCDRLKARDIVFETIYEARR